MRQPVRQPGRPAQAVLALAMALGLFACAPRVAEGFRNAKNAGDRAHSAGRYDEAASAYQRAGQEAGRPRDRAEALYLEAFSLQRARAWDRARSAYERLLVEMPTSDLARRGSFNLADLEIDAGNVDGGYDRYRRLMTKYPNEALAKRALERYLHYLETRGDNALTWLQSVLPELASTELDETARYRLAGYLEAASDLRGARDLYVECATRHPYPKGALFDDALWHASLLDEKLGRATEAIAHLRRMLATREASTLMGSYERPRFSAAQFRMAVLYRDALGDLAAARREFHRLYSDHPTSILRDDALWEEAKLSRDGGDAKEACSLAAALSRDFPASRYAPCTPAVCPSAPPPKARCHAYLLRATTGPASAETTAPAERPSPDE